MEFQGVRSTMLVELRAENYAVIDHAIASFGPGLNLLTGETGAGKSILVDALALLMGGKSSVEVVRHGADKAVVACVFESTPAAEAILEENGIDSEGNEIILRREILSTGKGRVFVNNQPATVAADFAGPVRGAFNRGRGRGTWKVASRSRKAGRTAAWRAGPAAHGGFVELSTERD